MGLFLNLTPTPTAAEVAAAVRVNLAAELARLDAAVSSRATPADVKVTTSTQPEPQVGVR